jgi:hypothetical protein
MRIAEHVQIPLVAGVLATLMLVPSMSVGKEFESAAQSTNEPALKASECTPGPRPTTYEGSGPPPKVGASEETATGETWGDHSYVIPLLEVIAFEASLNAFDRTFVEEGTYDSTFKTFEHNLRASIASCSASVSTRYSRAITRRRSRGCGWA